MDVLLKDCLAEIDAFLKVNVRENKRSFETPRKEDSVFERRKLQV
jgi:hypothetical protein